MTSLPLGERTDINWQQPTHVSFMRLQKEDEEARKKKEQIFYLIAEGGKKENRNNSITFIRPWLEEIKKFFFIRLIVNYFISNLISFFVL